MSRTLHARIAKRIAGLALPFALVLGAAACATAPREAPGRSPAAPAGNAERLRRIMEEVDKTWNFDPLVEQFADDVVFRVTIPDGTPASGEFHGKKAVAEYFTRTLPETAVFKQQAPMEFIGDGDRVIILGDDAYTLKKTGGTFRSPYAAVVKFEGAKIKSFLIIQDLSGMADAYRHPPPERRAGPPAADR